MSELISHYPLIAAGLAMVGLGLIFGAILGFAAEYFRTEGNPIADQVNAILPQTQCGQCGFPGCRPYAEAIAAGEAPINLCPPGGEAGVQALAGLLDVEPLPLDAQGDAGGADKPARAIAFIREEDCIGCTKCLQACPVDAIVGAAKQMHTVIGSECTGCDLCVDPCPVDCIELQPRDTGLAAWHWPLPTPISGKLEILATDIIVSDGEQQDRAA